MAQDKTTGRLRWASQRHPKGRPRKSTALSVFRRLSRADLRPPSTTEADLDHTRQTLGGTLSPTSASFPPSQPKPDTPKRNGNGVGTASAADEEEAKKKKRTIYFNMRLPPEETHDDGTPIHHYPRNKIRTAKYTPLTFIPKNLFLQFHNVANIYFTFIVILQVPDFQLPFPPLATIPSSPLSLFSLSVGLCGRDLTLQIFPIFGASNPGLGAVPIIVILAVTAFKDAMEDWRRTVLDNELNNARTKTLHEWHNVNVVDEHISLWRRTKKATSRTIRMISARRKGIKTDPHDLERSSTVIRLSESSVRHPGGDFPMETVRSHRESMNGGFFTAPSSPSAHSDTFGSPIKQPVDTGVIDRYRSTPQKAKFRTTFWKNVRVGDFILIRSDDQIPADIVVLATSDSDGACYVETKNLDGETNLKVRHALRCGSTIKSAHDCEGASFWIESEGPGPNLYSYNGAARWYHRDASNPGEGEPEIKAEAISIENLLLRGCNLKNTDWAIGVVVFTGAETRIMMNSGITPSKRSRIAKSLNWNVWPPLTLTLYCTLRLTFRSSSTLSSSFLCVSSRVSFLAYSPGALRHPPIFSNSVQSPGPPPKTVS